MACAGIGILVGLIFITDAGFIWLDAVDWYINFILLLVGFLEVFGAGWIFGIEDQISEIGSEVVISYMCTEFGAVIIACGIWFGVGSVGYGFLGLAVSFSTGMGAVLKLCQAAAITIKHVIPPILLVCFANLCAGGNFFKYGGYVTAYQVLGLLIVLGTMALFLIGVFLPEVYGNFLKLEIKESVDRLNGKPDKGMQEVEA